MHGKVRLTILSTKAVTYEGRLLYARPLLRSFSIHVKNMCHSDTARKIVHNEEKFFYREISAHATVQR